MAGEMPPRLLFYPAWLLSVALASCASVQQNNLKTFSDGISTVKTQADTAFVSVNALTSDAVIDYAAEKQNLDPANFFDVLDAASIAKWDDTFAALQKYSQSLLILTGTDNTKNYRDATSQLASQITETGQKLKAGGLISSAPQISPDLATAFAELGNVLLEAKASADARNTIRKADQSVQRIFLGMAAAIGPIRGTVTSNWQSIEGDKQRKFLHVQDDASAKRTLATQFADSMSKQKAQDLVLASLQKSLRALAQAHHALAQDPKFEVAGFVATVKQEANNTKELYDKMQSSVKPKS